MNERSEILLARRATHADSDAGVWGPSVSGRVEDDESAEQAAIREAVEELGVEATDVTPIHHLHDSTHDHADGDLREFSLFYANVPSTLTSKVTLDANEVATIKWISLDNLQTLYREQPETIIISANTKLWAEIFDNLKIASNHTQH
jgi:8-oxo-dGTP pyrophosphatase MutT (NUDIX family)